MSNKPNAAIQTISKFISDNNTVEDGILVDNASLIGTLPKNLKEKDFVASVAHIENFTAGSAHALGEMAHASGYEDVQGTFTSDKVNLSVEQAFHKTATIKGEEVSNYMTSSVLHTFEADGAVATVHAQIAALATSSEEIEEEA